MILLTAIQARILACLVEKEATVPETYPLTLNSLKLACNQKSNRAPVMKLEEGEILHTLNKLKEQELVMTDEGGKAFKYAHRVHKVLEIKRDYLAIITMLILRGEQTLNEIYTRSSRIFDFENSSQTQECLLQMIDDGFLVMLPKQSGKREVRYYHNLCGSIDITEVQNTQTLSPEQEKIIKLEHRVDNLQDNLDDLIEVVKELRMKKGN